MAIGDPCRHRLRGHRNGMNLSLADVAERVGITEADARAYETGACQPPATALRALAELFGTTVDDLCAPRRDGMRDYFAAVVAHMPPLADEEIAAIAAILRRIRHRQHTISHGASILGATRDTAGHSAPILTVTTVNGKG
ncbi:MAG: helix-turn-helix domain-containing protein [Gemmatimonadota bacterium]